MKMKRFVLLFTLTLAASAAILFGGRMAKNSILQVGVDELEPQPEEEAVVCTGKVESISNGSVYAPVSAITKQVYVKAGDKVRVGQALMLVSIPSSGEDDLEQTYASYLNSGISIPKEETTQTLVSPTSGTVTSVSVTKPGYYVDPSKPAVVIKSATGLQVRLNVNESQISEIQEGQKAEITGVGFKDSVYSGTVKEIASEAKQVITTTGQQTVIEVVVSVDNPGQDIKPGFTAKAKITTSGDSSVLIAPYEAVQADEDGSEYVFRVVGGKAVKTPIETGREFDAGFEVLKGLSAGDRVVTDSEQVSDGARVLASLRKAVSAG